MRTIRDDISEIYRELYLICKYSKKNRQKFYIIQEKKWDKISFKFRSFAFSKDISDFNGFSQKSMDYLVRHPWTSCPWAI